MIHIQMLHAITSYHNIKGNINEPKQTINLITLLNVNTNNLNMNKKTKATLIITQTKKTTWCGQEGHGR